MGQITEFPINTVDSDQMTGGQMLAAIHSIPNKSNLSQFNFIPPKVNIIGYNNQVKGAEAGLQGWENLENAAVYFDPDIGENIWRMYDNIVGEASISQYPMPYSDWLGISMHGMTGVQRFKIPTTVNDDTTNVWFGFSEATNLALQAVGGGWPSVTRGAFRYYLDRSGGVQTIRIDDGPSAGTYQLPEDKSDSGYNTFAMTKHPTNSDWMVLIINGDDRNPLILEVYQHNNNYADDRVRLGSGTSQGTGADCYMRSFEFVINYSAPEIHLTKEDIIAGKDVFVPPGIGDWDVYFPDADVPSNSGVKIFTATNGMVNLLREATDDSTLFNRQSSLSFTSTNAAKQIVVRQNSVDVDESGEPVSVDGRQYNAEEVPTLTEVTDLIPVNRDSEVHYNDPAGLFTITPGFTGVNLITVASGLTPESGALDGFFNASTGKLNVYNEDAPVTLKVNITGSFADGSTDRVLAMALLGTDGNSETKPRNTAVSFDVFSFVFPLNIKQDGNIATNGTEIRLYSGGGVFTVTDVLITANQSVLPATRLSEV